MSYAQAITYLDELPPMVQLPSPEAASPPGVKNPYYEEIVKDHPSVQSKIRKLDSNFFGKYEETLPPSPPNAPPVYFADDNRAVPLPNYPLIGTPPASLPQNYVPGGMVPRATEQHLPVAQYIPTHYTRPLAGAAYQSTYPTVEHIDCPQCKNWQSKCERMYWGIIGALLLVVLLLLYKILSRGSLK